MERGMRICPRVLNAENYRAVKRLETSVSLNEIKDYLRERNVDVVEHENDIKNALKYYVQIGTLQVENRRYKSQALSSKIFSLVKNNMAKNVLVKNMTLVGTKKIDVKKSIDRMKTRNLIKESKNVMKQKPLLKAQEINLETRLKNICKQEPARNFSKGELWNKINMNLKTNIDIERIDSALDSLVDGKKLRKIRMKYQFDARVSSVWTETTATAAEAQDVSSEEAQGDLTTGQSSTNLMSSAAEVPAVSSETTSSSAEAQALSSETTSSSATEAQVLSSEATSSSAEEAPVDLTTGQSSENPMSSEDFSCGRF